MAEKMLILETIKNFLDPLKEEISKILGDRNYKKAYDSFLIFNTDNITEDVFKIAMFSDITKRIYLFVGEEKSADDFYSLFKGFEWKEFFSSQKNFAVRVYSPFRKITGDEKIKIERDAGQAIVDYFKETEGKRIKVRLDNPDVLIKIISLDDKVYIVLDLLKEDLNSYENIIARYLVIASKWKPLNETLGEFLDGGIAKSAWHFGKWEPKKKRVLNLRLINLKLLDQKTAVNILSKNWSSEHDPKVFCYERKEKLNILKEKYIDYKKIVLRSLARWNASENIILSNLAIAEPRKAEEKNFLINLVEKLKLSNEWRKAILAIRSDLDLSDIEIDNIQKLFDGLNVRGLNVTIIEFSR